MKEGMISTLYKYLNYDNIKELKVPFFNGGNYDFMCGGANWSW